MIKTRRRLLPLFFLLVTTVHVLWDVLQQDHHDDNQGTMMMMMMRRGEEIISRGRPMFLKLPFVMAADIFMMGNSYTSANSLPTMVRDLFRGGAGDDADDDDDSGITNCGGNNNTAPTANATTATEEQQPLESKTTTIDVQAPGGWKIYQHAYEITTSTANTTHSQMLNAVTRFVILQDQSQVPSCACFGDEYTMNMEGIRQIRSAMPSDDVDLILFMTWGRLEYDNNLQFNNCFSEMQNNLRVGYESYRDNGRRQQLVNDGNGNEDDDRKNIYIAPVGYAFKYIHDNELCSHNTVTDAATTSNIATTIVESDFSLSIPPPTCVNPGVNNGLSTDCSPVTTSTVFASLYTSDGSHPQLGGSFLAACVLYATMTGISPIGRWGPTTESMSADEMLLFQQIAHKIVLDDYYNLGYDYPWQRNVNNDTVCPDHLPADTIAPVVVSTTKLPSPQTTQDPGATINDQPITAATDNDTPNESSSLAASKRLLRSWWFMQGAILTVLFAMLLQEIMLIG